MEFGAHLPVLSLAGESYSLERLTAYARAASQLGFTVLSAFRRSTDRGSRARLIAQGL